VQGFATVYNTAEKPSLINYLLFTLYFLFFTFFTIYSYTQVDLNLTLSDNPIYQVIGSHRGVWFYTIGQRHGFEITQWLTDNNQTNRNYIVIDDDSDMEGIPPERFFKTLFQTGLTPEIAKAASAFLCGAGLQPNVEG